MCAIPLPPPNHELLEPPPVFKKGQMSEIILTSSREREASSTGMSSEHKSFDTAQKGTILFYTWNTIHFEWVVEAGSLL